MSSTTGESIMTVPIRRVGVIDTDALINDMELRMREPGMGSLFARHGKGSTRWIASSHVLVEMYRPDALYFPDKFHKLCAQSIEHGWPTSAVTLQRLFETEYLCSIHFVNVDQVMYEHAISLSVAALDHKDTPTGQLAALMALTECVVYSCDRDLRRPKVAPPDLKPIIHAARTADAADMVVPSVIVVGNLMVLLMSEAVTTAAKHLRVPKLAGWSVFAVLLAWTLVTRDRRNQLGRGLGTAAFVVSEMLTKGERAKAALAGASIAAFDHPPLECKIARALALAGRPLLVREIRDAILRLDQLDPAPSDKAIRGLLRTLPCFVQASAHEWQLGEIRLPPADPAYGSRPGDAAAESRRVPPR